MSKRMTFRAALTAIAALAALAVCAPAAPAQATLDQQQTDGAGGPGHLNFTTSRAQVFTAGITGELDQADLFTEYDRAPGPLTVEIRTVDANGAPSDTVLAQTTVPIAAVPPEGSPAFMSVAFSPGAAVQAGTQYALVAYSTAIAAGYNWYRAVGNLYPGGSQWLADESPPSEWNALPNDLAFRTYVTPADATAPTSTATPSPGALAPGPG